MRSLGVIPSKIPDEPYLVEKYDDGASNGKG